MSRRLALSVLLFAAFVQAVLAADTGRYTTTCDCIYTNAPCAGEFRWAVKNDNTGAPANPKLIKKLTPTAMSHWPDMAPDPQSKTYKQDAPRTGYELKWYELTGRVTLIKAEPDGDLHIQMQDVKGTNGSVNVVAEIPAGPAWCPWRTKVFALTKTQPPFNAPNDLSLVRTDAVIRVVGRAFYDGTHANKGHQPNRRRDGGIDRNVTIWELHPVMDLQIK